MKNNFPHVFSPLTVRGMTLKNRVVMMPMGSDFAGHDGKLSDEHIKYYELRARGGTGLLYVRDRIIDGTDAGRHMVLNTLERLNYL